MDNYIKMIVFMLWGMLFAIVTGFVILSYKPDIMSMLSQQSVGKYGIYNIQLIDDVDVSYLKKVVPEKVYKDIAVKILGDQSNGENNNNPLKYNKMLTGENRNFDRELPWDQNVIPCDVLKNRDFDVYENVLNNKIITIY